INSIGTDGTFGNEDTEQSSMAGNYESVLDVDADDPVALAGALDAVAASYTDKTAPTPSGENPGVDPDHQILVQPMVSGVSLSGVAFTADLETGAPYHIINYDRSGSTELITSGAIAEHRSLIVYKHGDAMPTDPDLRAVVTVLREIEAVTGYTSLDVEFAVRKGGVARSSEVIVFQVRPIAAHKDQLRVSAVDVGHELAHVARFLELDHRDRSSLAGTRGAWGVMPDWNPAEIIGINPRPLAFSLYRHVITDEIWGRSREECGYRRTRPRPGIVDLAGKPYVDIRMSFTSFTPATLSEDLADRLVTAAVDYVAENPTLHDKVEFAVMPTAYDLDFDARLTHLIDAAALTETDRHEITLAYRSLTMRMITGDGISVAGELSRLGQLETRRELVIRAVRHGEITPAAALAVLLDDCREYGTLPFSNLARFAFVGVIQLRALVARGLLSQGRVDQFLASIETVAKEFVRDLAVADRQVLIERYGHLRPGTYDITSPAYHEGFDRYVDLDNRPVPEQLPAFILSREEQILLDQELKRAGFVRPDGSAVSAEELLTFIRSAVQAREAGKFAFTRNLSAAIDLIGGIAESEGLSRDDASYLVVDDLLALSGASRPAGLAAQWGTTVDRRRRRHLVTTAIRLPPVISDTADLQCFEISDEQPNFVTQQVVHGTPRRVHGIDPDIAGAIVLIENADPGFDWIFSHEIAALVTKFGGANSHMAIRCAEFEIPAAIGCGEAIFERLEKAHLVRLDCGSRSIEVIR
ncbi:MAG: PEP-utilizing enzyme, partial [Alkalispirochaeta sp.]